MSVAEDDSAAGPPAPAEVPADEPSPSPGILRAPWAERYQPIAAAADHPLLPWFLARVERRTRWHHYLTGRFPGQTSPLVYVLLFFVLSCFVIVLIIASILLRNLRSGRALERPSDFFFTDDRHRLHDLWLTRISARDMLAMEIAIHLDDSVHHVRRMIFILVAVLGVIFTPLWILTSISDPMYLLVWFAATLLAGSLVAIYGSEVMYIRAVIANFERVVKKRRAGAAGSTARSILTIVGLCVAVPFGFYIVALLFGFLFSTLENFIPIVLALLLFAVAALIIHQHLRVLPRKTLVTFEKAAARCEEHFAEILRAESEKPGK